VRRPLLALAVLLAALAVGLTACNDAEEVAAAPDTVIGETTAPPTEPTETETDTGTTTGTTTETETETGGGLTGDPVAGKAVFTGASACYGCHTLSDADATGTVGPNFDQTKPSEALVIDRVTNGKGQMPAFGSSLTEQQIADVAAYISQAAGS
jgi:mono/diheme cytochrome c family protein